MGDSRTTKRWIPILVAGIALIAALPAVSASSTCPGPGCMPVGTVSVTTPAAGKASYYAVTFTGKASAATPVALSINGPGPTGNVTVVALEGKPTVKGGTETATIYLAIANGKLKHAAALAASLAFEGFAPAGKLSNATAKATPLKCSVFKSKYPKAPLWKQFWMGESPKGSTDALELIAEFFASGGTYCSD